MSDLVLILIAYSPIVLFGVFLLLRKLSKERTISNSPEAQLPEPTFSRSYFELKEEPHKERILAEEPNPEYEDMHRRLVELMEKEKLYYKPDIRLADVAQRLFTNKVHLSKVIKETTQKNFCQLIHYFRIKEVMRLFSKDPQQNIIDLAFKVGFNSASTFNIAFGRIAGYTPAEWSRDYRIKTQRNDFQKDQTKSYSRK